MPKKPKGPAYHAERVKKIIERHPNKFSASIKGVKFFDWLWRIASANYAQHNLVFRHALGTDIIDRLQKIPRGKNTPLRVIVDGAGYSDFPEKLKAELKQRGIDSEVTITSIKSTSKLRKKVKTGKIDRLVAGPAELFVPEKPVDAIISRNASVMYTMESLKKEHLLKYAYSLKKGGIMLVNFAPSQGLSPNPKITGKMKVGEVLKGIQRALEKRGFKARFFPDQFSDQELILVLERVK